VFLIFFVFLSALLSISWNKFCKEEKKPLVYCRKGVTFAALKTTKDLFLGKFKSSLTYCFDKSERLEKNIKKSIV